MPAPRHQDKPMVTRALCQHLSPGAMSQGPGATACHLPPALSEASEDKVGGGRGGMQGQAPCLLPSLHHRARVQPRACPLYPPYMFLGHCRLGHTPGAVGLARAPAARDESRPGCSRAGVSAARPWGAGTPGLPVGTGAAGGGPGVTVAPAAARGTSMRGLPSRSCRRQVSAPQN